MISDTASQDRASSHMVLNEVPYLGLGESDDRDISDAIDEAAGLLCPDWSLVDTSSSDAIALSD